MTALLIYGVSLAIYSVWVICALVKVKYNPYADYVPLIPAVTGFMWLPLVNTLMAVSIVLFGFRLIDEG